MQRHHGVVLICGLRKTESGQLVLGKFIASC